MALFHGDDCIKICILDKSYKLRIELINDYVLTSSDNFMFVTSDDYILTTEEGASTNVNTNI